MKGDHVTTNRKGNAMFQTSGAETGPMCFFEPLEQRLLLDAWYVDAGADPGGDGSQATPFQTIQEGLDASAGSVGGDTINVAAGIYEENVVVDAEDVVLRATDGQDVTTILGTLDPGSHVIELTGNATNFTLGADLDPGDGIVNGFTVASGGGTDELVLFSGPATGVVINYNAFDTTDNAAVGVLLDGAGGTVTIDQNTFLAPEDGDSAVVGSDVTLNATDNTMTGPGAGLTGAGITLDGATGGYVHGNIIADFGVGVLLGNTAALAGPEVSANEISTSGVGVELSITGAEAITGVIIEDNTLAGNDVGLSIPDDATIETENFSVTGNSFVGNTVGLEYLHATEPLDATGNWWGSVGGPTIDSNVYSTADPGDELVDPNGLVTYFQWLDAADGADYAPVTNTTTLEVFGSIQEAIDDAETLAGHTILAQDGTFTEDLDIDKAVILASVNGAFEATTAIQLVDDEGIIIRTAAAGLTIGPDATSGFQILAGVDTTVGISVEAAADDVIIGNNLIDVTGAAVPINAIDVADAGAAGLIVGGNEIATAGGTGIRGPALTLLVIADNTLTGDTTGTGIELWGPEGVVSGNTITSFADGMIVYHDEGMPADALGVLDNTFDQNANGLRLAEGLIGAADGDMIGIRIDTNTFTANENGLVVEDGVFILSSNFVVVDNTFAGNTTAGVDHQHATETLDVTMNWWGTVGGPDIDSNVFDIPGEMGDAIVEAVADRVAYFQWLDDAAPDGVAFVPVTNVDTAEIFQSIQAAIDDAETLAGHTIQAADGTFTEDLVIDKADLTLESLGGAFEGTSIIQLAGVAVNGIDVTVDGGGFLLGGDEATGFDIRSGALTESVIAIATGADGVEISFNLIDAWWDANCDAIVVADTGVADLTVTDNEIWTDTGTGLYGPLLDNALIDDNLFESETAGVGIELYAPSGTTVVSENEISSEVGIAVFNDVGIADGDLAITDNEIIGCLGGILLANGDLGGVPGPMTGVIITGNLIADNGTGLLIEDGDDIEADTFTVTDNLFEANTTALDNQHLADQVTAVQNWWGSENGPEVASNTYNVGDQGDPIAGDIAYVRWLDSDVLGELYAPVQNLTQATWYASINAALADAAENDVIEADDGEFTEDLVVNESGITLQSANGAFETTGIYLVDTGIQVQADADGFTLGGGETSGFAIYNAGLGNPMLSIANGADGVEISYNVLESGSDDVIVVDDAGVAGLNISDNEFYIDGGGLIGIYGPALDGATIADNYFDGNGGETGVELLAPENGTTVTGNEFYDLDTGVLVANDTGIGAGDLAITDNQFNANDTGILVVVGGPDGTGDMTGLEITDNVFSGNWVGLDIVDSDFVLADTFTISDNNFTGPTGDWGSNDTALIYGGDETIDVTGNWWGSPSGPTIETNAFNFLNDDNPEDPVDQGEVINAADPTAVTFAQWLTAPVGGQLFAPVQNVTTGAWYASIQAAVDEAVDDDVIQATDGLYTEDLAIAGADGLTIRSASGQDATFLQLDVDGIDVAATAEGLTLGGSEGRGFEILSGAADPMIELAIGANGVTISHNYLDADDSNGSIIWAAEPVAPGDDVEGLTVTNNGFYNDGGYAIYGPALTDATITDNEFEDEDGTGIAIELWGAAGTVLISGNEIDNYNAGILVYSDDGVADGVLTISGNLIEDSATGLAFEDQDLGGDTGPIVGVTVTGNEFDENETGLFVGDGDDIQPATFTITGNLFVDNATGIENAHLGVDPLDASSNWWDSESGPTIDTNTYEAWNDEYDPIEQGDFIDDTALPGNVVYSPWLDAAPGDGGVDFAPVTLTPAIAGPDLQFSSIGAALAVAEADDVIETVAGTYTEDLLINDDGVTLQSADGAQIIVYDEILEEDVTYALTVIQLVDDAGIEIDADNVTLGGTDHGFVIVASGATTEAVLVGSAGLTVQDNLIDLTVGGAQTGISMTETTTLQVLDNEIGLGAADTGITWNPDATDLVATDTTITGNELLTDAATDAGIGIAIGNFTNMTISQNVFEMGIFVQIGGGDVASTNLDITQNTFPASPVEADLQGVTFVAEGDGVLSDVLISQNSFEYAETGVVFDGLAAGGALLPASIDWATLAINENSFLGVEDALVAKGAALDDTVAIDAQNNFWGVATGPAAPGSTYSDLDADISKIKLGDEGDLSAAVIDYDPYWVDITGDPGTYVGTPGAFQAPVSLTHDVTVTYYNSIQAAIDAAVAGGDIVEATPGLYTEDLAIPDTLTGLIIRSAEGADIDIIEEGEVIGEEPHTVIQLVDDVGIDIGADSVQLGQQDMGFTIVAGWLTTSAVQLTGDLTGVMIDDNVFDLSWNDDYLGISMTGGTTDLVINDNDFHISDGTSAITWNPDTNDGVAVNTQITENEVTVDWGNDGAAVWFGNLTDMTITDNTFEAAIYVEVRTEDSAGLDILRNTFQDSGFDLDNQGVIFCDDGGGQLSDVVISQNNFDGSKTGVIFAGDWALEHDSIDWATLTITENRIFDVENGIVLRGASMNALVTVSALDNWWGADTGPIPAGSTYTDPDGTASVIHIIDGATGTVDTSSIWTDFQENLGPGTYTGTPTVFEQLAPVQNISQGTFYYSIEDAIAAAVAGDIIEAIPGMYTEDIDLDVQGITLRSTQGAQDADGEALTIIQLAKAGIQIDHDGITLGGVANGFTIRSGENGIDELVWIHEGQANVSILGNVFDSREFDGGVGIGIYMTETDNLLVDGNEFILDQDDIGMTWDPWDTYVLSADTTITDNTFTTDDTWGPVWSPYAIEIGNANDTLIEGNTFGPGLGVGIYSVLGGGWVNTSGLTITGNTFAAERDEWGNAIDEVEYAILFDDGGNGTLSNVAITQNDFDECDVGVEFDWIEDTNLDWATLHINYNRFNWVDEAIYIGGGDLDDDVMIDAAHNWWGDSGPNTEDWPGGETLDNSSYTAPNGDGKESAIVWNGGATATVEYLPFWQGLTGGAGTYAGTDFVPVQNLTQATDHVTIQDAIDNAVDGDTIIAYDGTFEEDLVIDVPNLTITSDTGAFATTTLQLDDGVGILIEANAAGFTLGGGATSGFNVIAGGGTTNMVDFTADPGGVVLSFNIFDGAGDANNGINADQPGAGLMILNNQFLDIWTNGINGAFGLTDVTITGNDFTDMGAGVNLDGVGGTSLVGNNTFLTIVDGLIVSNGEMGVTGLTIDGNEFNGCFVGLSILESEPDPDDGGDIDGLIITGNTFGGNETGLLIGGGDHILVGTFDVTDNSFRTDNGRAVHNENAVFLVPGVNWWGDRKGPIHPTNPKGAGAVVDGNVNFFDAEFAGETADPQPDLTVTLLGQKITLNDIIVPGDKASIKATITNLGDGEVNQEVKVMAYLQEVGTPNIIPFDIDKDMQKIRLKGGKSKAVTIKGYVPYDADLVDEARYEIFVTVDEDNLVAEIDEGNNEAVGFSRHEWTLKFGTIPGRRGRAKLTLPDPVTGDDVTFSMTGVGFGQVGIQADGGDVDELPDGFNLDFTGNSTRSKVTVKTDKDESATLNDVDMVGGFGNFDARTSDLRGEFTSLGPTGTLTFGDVTGGKEMPGADPDDPADNFWVPGGVTVFGATKGVKALRWQRGDLEFDTLAKLDITGQKARGENPEIEGDFGADLEINDLAQAKYALGKVTIKGDLDGAMFDIVGNVSSVKIYKQMTDSHVAVASTISTWQVGAMLNSTLFAGVANPLDELPDPDNDGVFDLPTELGAGDGQIAPDHELKKFYVKGYKGSEDDGLTDLFVNSNIAASKLGTVYLKDVALDNAGTPFGFAGDALQMTKTKLTIKQSDPKASFTWKLDGGWGDDPEDNPGGDFDILAI